MIARRRSNYYAGGLVVLIGLSAALIGATYDIGSLTAMGSGFFPALLGILMVIVGIMIAFSPADEAAPALMHDAPRRGADWRGWGAILTGGVLFIVLAQYAGLLPAAFACVFVTALGDRQSSWKQAAVLATAITVFGVLLFAYGLQIPIPILRGF
jgi:hypothetical protein